MWAQMGTQVHSKASRDTHSGPASDCSAAGSTPRRRMNPQVGAPRVEQRRTRPVKHKDGKLHPRVVVSEHYYVPTALVVDGRQKRAPRVSMGKLPSSACANSLLPVRFALRNTFAANGARRAGGNHNVVSALYSGIASVHHRGVQAHGLINRQAASRRSASNPYLPQRQRTNVGHPQMHPTHSGWWSRRTQVH